MLILICLYIKSKSIWSFYSQTKNNPIKKLTYILSLISLITKLFYILSIWLNFTKTIIKQKERQFDENRKTHIEFYRNTIKGRFTNRDTKKSVFYKQGAGVSNSNSFSNNVNNSKFNVTRSYESGLFKK